MIEISAAEARRLRAQAQLLCGSTLRPAEVVRRAGAMQGQDLAAVQRAIAMRSAPGVDCADVRAAFDAGELVRGWPMRGTLFAAAPEDLAGITRMTAPRMQVTLRTRRANMGLSERDYEIARDVAVAALDAGPRSRAELAELWRGAGLPGGAGIDYHLTSTLGIDGVLVLGRFSGREQLVERARPAVEDEAEFLARLARAFFAARGPATLDDLAWWVKLPKSLLTPAVESLDGLEALSVEGVPMRYLQDEGALGAGAGAGGGTTEISRSDGRMPAPRPSDRPISARSAAVAEAGVVLVPGFDEWLLGYQSRGLVASPAMLARIATVNGIFRPAVLLDGVVIGSWTAAKQRKPASADILEPITAAQRRAVDAAVAAWPFE